MQFHDNLEIPGGNTRRQFKVKVGLGYCPAEDKCSNLHEKRNQGETLSEPRLQSINSPIPDDIISRKQLLLQEAFMIGSTSCPWA